MVVPEQVFDFLKPGRIFPVDFTIKGGQGVPFNFSQNTHLGVVELGWLGVGEMSDFSQEFSRTTDPFPGTNFRQLDGGIFFCAK